MQYGVHMKNKIGIMWQVAANVRLKVPSNLSMYGWDVCGVQSAAERL